MKKLLVIIGGMRVGDCIHLIPFFDSKQDYEITWITGSYEQYAAKLIAGRFSNIKRLVVIDDGFPGDLVHRDNFCRIDNPRIPQDIVDQISHLYFDDIITDHHVSFDMTLDKSKLKDNYFGKSVNMNYIVTHLDTVSDWKRHEEIRKVRIEGTSVVGLGLPGEFILPGSKDYRGRLFPDTVTLLETCSFFVGIHSAIACLNLYVGKPAIIIHPMPGLLTFSTYRSNTVDLVQPSCEVLQQKILEFQSIYCTKESV